MSILHDILTWSHGLPAWQSDAIARLFDRQTLTAEDLDDLYALLKKENGIPDPQDRTAQTLSADQIPSAVASSIHLVLLAMKDLEHVNAIAEKQRLVFGPQGLTVIYGDNGSGKSGYSRVLKRACRARDQSEPIYPNAFLPSETAGTAQAKFEVSVDGVEEEYLWNIKNPSPEILSSLSVFDARCARAYLDNENDFAYIPYGFDILEGLAQTCRQLKEKIEREHAQQTVDLTVFAALIDDVTEVGKLIANLSCKTQRKHVEALTTISPEEISRRDELEKNLKESNPKEKAQQIRILSRRIAKLIQNITGKLAIVDDRAVEKMQELTESYQAAQTAAVLSAQKFKEDINLLPCTGGGAWKELFEAARKFSAEAYRDKVFPDLGRDTPCPLCQQPLAEGVERLQRFEEFVQQESEKAAQSKKKILDEAYNVFIKQNVTLGLDDELYAEIEALDKALALDIRTVEASLISRLTAIKTAVVSTDWGKFDSLPRSPVEQLQLWVEKLNQNADTLEKATDEKARAILQQEFNELNSRIGLLKVKPAVLSAIDRLEHQTKLTKCLSAVKTNAISHKTTEFAEKVISKELEEALNREFKVLGAGNLLVQLQSRSAKGKALHKLKLNLPQAKTPGDILSEGEQRAIAIGSFLAEVNMSGSTGGVIFDDPVSSLDHKRRERVAKRLVQEAAKRQVIILTHDVYFLCLLMEETRKAGISILTQSLSRRAAGFGVAANDLPFEGMNTKSRIGFLRNMQGQIDKVYRAGDEPKHRELTYHAYQLLRIAWERGVEEVLFRNVVLRFRKGIETQRLAGVAVEDNDFVSVNEAMTKCSNYAHDQALLGGVALPDPDELLADINALDEWRKSTEDRAITINKKRKAAVTASA
ncbi:MAG: AAA family ATPase [Desulfobulbaceae bacterium]|nr:AAA family ATPase [Desulfobulbaceae bacterium]